MVGESHDRPSESGGTPGRILPARSYFPCFSAGMVPVCLIFGQQSDKTILQQLDVETRAKLLLALAGLVVLGLAMMTLTWLGARATRRFVKQSDILVRKRSGKGSREHDWSEKPLVSAELEDDNDAE